jgi:hypothetical protein
LIQAAKTKAVYPLLLSVCVGLHFLQKFGSTNFQPFQIISWFMQTQIVKIISWFIQKKGSNNPSKFGRVS